MMWDLLVDVGLHHLEQRDFCSSRFQNFVTIRGEGLKLELWNKCLFSCLKSIESDI